MKMSRDSAGHFYADVDNIRVTFIPAHDRATGKDWSNSDVIRVQSYKNTGVSHSLQQGAEFPVSSPDSLIRLIETLCAAYHGGSQQGNTQTKSVEQGNAG